MIFSGVNTMTQIFRSNLLSKSVILELFTDNRVVKTWDEGLGVGRVQTRRGHGGRNRISVILSKLKIKKIKIN